MTSSERRIENRMMLRKTSFVGHREEEGSHHGEEEVVQLWVY